jgi:predicted  nucleic acid-binding Zn-ribbon protein
VRLGGGVVSGIGFTVAILIATLSFEGRELAEAKLGVLATAIASALLAWAVFRVVRHLPEAMRARQQAEADLAAAASRFEADQNSLKAQIARMQASVVDAMARSNNPARIAIAVREQVEARLSDAKQEWQLHWEGERKRLNAEIERLKNAAISTDAKKAAARRALLEKLGKLPPSSGGGPQTTDQWETELQNAKINFDTERDQLNLKIKKLEMELQRSQDSLRNEIFQQMHAQYEPRLDEANRERSRLEIEIQSLTRELEAERQRSNARIEQLEKAIPEAQEAARTQAMAELQDQVDLRLEESNRLRSRMERKHQDDLDDWEAERRRFKKHIAALEERLKELKEIAYKAQKASGRVLLGE